MVKEYLKEVISKFKTDQTTEHSFRSALQEFIERTVNGVQAINEPRRQKCGAPDYIIQNKRSALPIGYIEAKDININLDTVENTEQLERYKKSLENLILTNYLEFRFFVNGKRIYTVCTGKIENGKIIANEQEYDKLINQIRNFCAYKGETIKTPVRLADLMAQKAVMIRDCMTNILERDKDGSLAHQKEAFKKVLLHDLDNNTFSDMYAQTIAYGLFAARLNSGGGNFTRRNASELVSKSNPFLRQLFDYIAGINLDEGLAWIVDDLAEVFRYVDLASLLKTYFEKQKIDPFLHFYETFLQRYDKAAKKKRGVYYTPAPVVKFIVNVVDEILQDEFNLSLADNSRIKHNDKDVFKVQILDPAAGTGTFLAECVNKIYEKFKTQKGVWQDYVNRDLIPGLNGFEIMMTPYVVCHLKLEHQLKETGVKTDNRFNVYLTNALEECELLKNPMYGLYDWLTEEAAQAGKIKEEAPIMVVLGNPPYSVGSCNKNKYIEDLISEYKKDLNEKNIQPLSDDYIKFIRLGEHFIEKNKEGI